MTVREKLRSMFNVKFKVCLYLNSNQFHKFDVESKLTSE